LKLGLLTAAFPDSSLEEVARWAAGQSLKLGSSEDMAAHPAVRELVEGELAQVNRELASFEQVKYFRILPRDLSMADGELTPTLKVKRNVVNDHIAGGMAALYRVS